MPDETAARDSFREQAQWCLKLGSPFTARLCEALATNLAGDTPIGREVLDWRGNPRAAGDALALRIAGALHALVRGGLEPGLAALYPPAPPPEPSALWLACRAAFVRHERHFRDYLSVAPQTNEVGRSGVLIAGFLEFSRRFGVPLHLFEIGASAGLNLFPDLHRYRFGATSWGPANANLELAPEWNGNAPPVDAGFRVASRQGSDLAPIDIRSPAERLRLLSYVWPDQFDRIRRLELAVETALASPPLIEAMDAADWVDLRLPPEDAVRSGGRVLFHSVVWNYLSSPVQRRIEARVAECGAAATLTRPFGWLRFELEGSGGQARLELESWPRVAGSGPQVLATANPHATSVTYLL